MKMGRGWTSLCMKRQTRLNKLLIKKKQTWKKETNQGYVFINWFKITVWLICLNKTTKLRNQLLEKQHRGRERYKMGKTKWLNLFSFPSHIELLKEGEPISEKKKSSSGERKQNSAARIWKNNYIWSMTIYRPWIETTTREYETMPLRSE